MLMAGVHPARTKHASRDWTSTVEEGSQMEDISNNETLSTLKRIRCEVYSRIVGYLRPVQDWNKGKQVEFADRRPYTVERIQAPKAGGVQTPVGHAGR